jgi:anti-sigma regulatory factor (Ser/Thr protein kinase)
VFERRFGPIVQEIPNTRWALRAWLEAEEVPAETVRSILVVASELVTNGVMHAGGATITLRAFRSRADVSVEVRTAARPAGSAPFSRASEGRLESGRGLLLVAGLADDHSVATEGGQRVDRCRFVLERQKAGAGAR